MCTSYHYSKDRQVREKVITEMIGNGKIIKTVTMQEKNRSFPATYQISDTGIVTILDVSLLELWQVQTDCADIIKMNLYLKNY